MAHLRGKLARQDELLESQRGAVRAAGARVAAQRNELADQDAALSDSQALVAAQGDLLQQQLMDMQASCGGEVGCAVSSSRAAAGAVSCAGGPAAAAGDAHATISRWVRVVQCGSSWRPRQPAADRN